MGMLPRLSLRLISLCLSQNDHQIKNSKSELPKSETNLFGDFHSFLIICFEPSAISV